VTRGRATTLGFASLRSPSIVLAQTRRFGVAHAPQPKLAPAIHGLHSLGPACAPPSGAALVGYAGSRSTGDPSLSALGLELPGPPQDSIIAQFKLAADEVLVPLRDPGV